jgi:hypothetical protein
MAIETLEIHFRGACTHFHHNFVPGIPHRVVLPNADRFFPGLLTGPFPDYLNPPFDPKDPASWIHYWLMPHKPTLAISDLLEQPFTTPGLFNDRGELITPSRLQIVNTIDEWVSYPEGQFLKHVHSLPEFFAGYVPSADVVTGGRASAYFDFYGGQITSFLHGDDIRVKAVVATDGPPVLQVTPLDGSNQTVAAKNFTIESDTAPTILVVGNVGCACEGAMSQYDFILHYLTCQTGIPREVTKRLPGMIQGLPPSQMEELPGAMKILADMVMPGQAAPPPLKLQPPSWLLDLSASCSDSRYP